MKKIIFALFIGIICLKNMEARDIIGYYISKSNDTLRVTFKIPIKFFSQEPNYERLQCKIKYFDSNKKKMILKPNMANEISFDYEGKKIRFLSRPNDLDLYCTIFSDNSNLFLHLIKDGKLKLFKYYQTNNTLRYNPSTGMTTGGLQYIFDNYIMQKGNEELFVTGLFSFRKDMVDYLSDCPDLSRKIEDKIYRSYDIEKIIDEYNQSCH